MTATLLTSGATGDKKGCFSAYLKAGPLEIIEPSMICSKKGQCKIPRSIKRQKCPPGLNLILVQPQYALTLRSC